MARAQVEQVRCDRCKRVQLLPIQPKKEHPDFEARLGDKTLKYDDLCTSCKDALKHVWDTGITQWKREIKQQFGPTVTAAPLTPAPDYTPPKPHSQAAAKK